MQNNLEFNSRKSYKKSTQIIAGKGKNIPTRVMIFALFSVIALVLIIPFYTLLISTFKDGAVVVANGMDASIDIAKMSFKNYVILFTEKNSFFTWFFNSLFLTIGQVALQLFVSAFVAYGFAMYDFKGKNFLFICVLFVMMVPFEILMLPLYSQISTMHLTNSYAGIILPSIAQASTIFFFRQYLSGIPKDLVEAGRIDGASEYGIFFRLILPIMKPSFAAMAILNAMGSWNNLLWPMLVLKDSSKFTLPIGLNTLMTPYGNNFNLLFVGSFLSILPIFILFMCFQKYFVDGMTAGAVKG
ncbi:arabinosaccharide transport system permease protein [Clostridium saccharoperbutylacetonicum]|jgi:arabinosaccharide transport system permease protein|uniref:L-arabinose transport system permease protein AraQ n=1 Tax=Clostridium saccharoperbutylacetonicum N1-4(HMT) TaxID=931276 RepID=M1MP31_9CLOT|nr:MULTISPECIES: carbohydrate ABC transporter permease [Clostridium]AGF57973.1 L-arabinose transport system permease protein AraQ [Clostridium saccharoperbutylacetonicum N1-4(HMT)]NRT61254.1 arabinosaccharide transport system permease protein [Clostridium saccharoperbutylacetonicum]NSB24571.1 arabinosaccharide transport system permease protein [Clostridium saccharoperbutylacetonicum]NSB43946.1 arabinosaccharide transport system permease protein [Clostridium saccharoperbutylacetonicum]